MHALSVPTRVTEGKGFKTWANVKNEGYWHGFAELEDKQVCPEPAGRLTSTEIQ